MVAFGAGHHAGPSAPSRSIDPLVRAVTAFCLALTALAAVFVPRQSLAQTGPEVVLWLPTAAEDATVSADRVEEILFEILGSARDVRHIVGTRGLERAIADFGLQLPTCVQGYEPCVSAREAILQALGAQRIVQLVARGDGTALDVTVSGTDLVPLETFSVQEPDIRRAAYAAITHITNATAWLHVGSTPPGARVLFDGVEVGTTPYEQTLPIQTFVLSVELDGYFSWETRVELRAGDHRVIEASLARRSANVIVRNGLPGAQVFLGDDPTPRPVSTYFDVEPGAYALELRAPGYDSQFYHLEVVAGDERELRMDLRESRQTIMRRERQRLLDRPLLLQAGLGLGGAALSLSGASGDAWGETPTIDCPAAATPGACADDVGTAVLGLDADVIYTWGHLQIPLLSLGVRALPMGDARVYALRDNPNLVAISGGRAIALGLPGVGARWLYDDTWEPYGQVQPRLLFEHFSGRESGLRDNAVEMSRTRFALAFQAGLRVHVNRLMYGFGAVDLEWGVAADSSARASAMVGMGLNLPSPLNRRASPADATPPSDAPGPDAPPLEL